MKKLITVLMAFGLFIPASAVTLKGKVLKIKDNYVLIQLNEREGCKGKKRFRYNEWDIKNELREGEEVYFKARINRSCEGEIIEVVEQ